MLRTVNAKYANGVLKPLEPLDLEEGSEVVLSIEMAPTLVNKSDEGGFVDKYRYMLPSHIDEDLMIEEYLEKERKIRERNG